MTNESVQQSLLNEADTIERDRANKVSRQHAFRVAFDFLEKHLPTQNTEEYWLNLCNDVSYVASLNDNNMLCQELLCAVLVYIADYEVQKK